MAGTLDEQISQIEFSCFYNSTAVRLRTRKAQTDAVGRRNVRNMKTLVDSITWQEHLNKSSLGVRSPSSSHTSRPKTFSFRGPCAGVQISRVERQWS